MNAIQPAPIALILHRGARFRDLEALLALAREQDGLFAIEITESLEELPVAMERLLLERRARVLGICGGDGSIHHALNTAVAIVRQAGWPLEELPPVYLLLGGSMNILGQALGLRGDPVSRLRALLAGHAVLNERRLPLVSVRVADGGERFGFVLGSEITARAIELHKLFGGNTLGLARLLLNTTFGAIFRTQFWKENGRLLAPSVTPLLADGIRYDYLAVVASAVDLKLLGGWITGLAVGERPLRVRILEPVSASGVIGRLPHLAFGWRERRIVDLDDVRRLELTGAFSLDGEVYAGGSLLAARTEPWVRFLV